MPPQFTPTQIARFWAKVKKTDTCWLWDGAFTARKDYGYVKGVGRRPWLAHRLAYTLTYGPIPDGAVVMHVCDNPPCVRPDHLRVGSQLDNVADRHAKGRDAKGITNAMVAHPERHWKRLGQNPTARGDQHYTRRSPELVRRGERVSQAKLTEVQVRAIRATFAAGGVSQRAIAQQYAVSPETVRLIVLRRTWQHVL